MALEKFRASPLPIAPLQYDQGYMNQLSRALSIYFSQLDSQTPNAADSYRALKFFGGEFHGEGFGLKLPHVAASDSTDQFAVGDNTPTVVKWNTLDSAHDWVLDSPGSATASRAGVYTIRYSLQVANTATNSAHSIVVWLKVNDIDVPNSATEFSIAPAKSSNVPTFICAVSEITFSVNAGDEIMLYWATGAASDVYIFHDVAQTTPYGRPAIPSAIGSITFVSAI